MKSSLRSLPLFATLAAALAFTSASLRANDEENTSTIKFSDPAKPGTLKVSLPWADIHVVGTDAKEVSVTTSMPEKGKAHERDSNGLRRLDEDVSYELTEKENVAVLAVDVSVMWGSHDAEFFIKVPHDTRIVIRTQAGGDIVVEKVDGDVDINSMNGEVTLRDLTSSAIVNTMNGEIGCTFKQAPTKPISLSSMNGEIALYLPGDTKANLRMRTHNGSIMTDFDDNILKAKSENRVRHLSGENDDSEFKRNARTAIHGSRDAIRNAARAVAGAVGVRSSSTSSSRAVDAAAREADKAARDADKAASEADKAAREAARALDRAAIAPVAPQAPETPEAPMPALAPIARIAGIMGGKSVVGTLNGGGIDITLASMNGTVTVRQVK